MVNFKVLENKANIKGYKTLAALERAADLGNGVIGKWRTSSPNLDSLEKIADKLECTIDELVTKEEK